MLNRPSAKLFVHFFEPVENFFTSIVAKWLILNITVDVGAGHVGMEVALHCDLEFQVLVSLHVVDELWGLERLAHTDR